jgi:hypothetical protein
MWWAYTQGGGLIFGGLIVGGLRYTNKLHLLKLPYTHCMYEFILLKKYRNYNMQ